MENNHQGNLLPLNLQFFADPAPAPAPEPKPGGDPTPSPAPSPEPAPEQAKIPAFSELLKDKDFRSALDQHTSKATETAVTKAVEDALKKERVKWEEEAKLSEADLAKKRAAEADAVLAEREQKLALRELRSDMATEIAKRALPAELIDALSMKDKDSATASLDALEKAWRASVEAGVATKLKGNPPADPSGGAGGGTLQDEIAAKLFPKT